ncbi:MAG TPA: hypothetical protein VJA25_00270, partial [Dehalococcoidia bacterium]|nr:hypothetical protein [Dehalococcoidia bacterium]
ETSRAHWIATARDVALGVCDAQGWVTADDVRRLFPIPEEYDGRVMGAVFCKRLFRKVGYQATAVPTSHGRPIAIFQALSQPRRVSSSHPLVTESSPTLTEDLGGGE